MKGNEVEINEELKRSTFRAVGNLIYYLQNDKPDKYRAEVDRLITLILSAVRDGQKIPGEVGRGPCDGTGSLLLWDKEALGGKLPTLLIAVHKEEAGREK